MKINDLITEAQEILEQVGMDEERTNKRSALTFLALAHMDASKSWSEATGDMYTTYNIMTWIDEALGVKYAPNTRETIRRFTLHQFIAGGIVEYNADDPNRPVNSPKNNYRITPALLKTIRQYGTDTYEYALLDFNDSIESWVDQRNENRGMNTIPVNLPDGQKVNLSAGGQNTLIKQMIEELCPRFAPGGEILYIDDTNKKLNIDNHEVFRKFDIKLFEHGKAPDLIVWLENKQWLFLMEACSSHGPIDTIRKRDLNKIFHGAYGHIVYISCFPNRTIMKRYFSELAWETEVWCADSPDHLIHLDGHRFLGPYK